MIARFLTISFFIFHLLPTAKAQNWKWAETANNCTAGSASVGGSRAVAVVTDNSGNIYFAGVFSDTSITFGSTKLTNPNIQSNSDQHFFLVKYNSDGIVLWARSVSDSNSSIVSALAVDNLGNVFIAGSYNSRNISFGSYTLTDSNSNYSNFYSDFIAKYDSSGNVVLAKELFQTNNISALSIISAMTVDNNGNIVITGEFPLLTTGSSIKFADSLFAFSSSGDMWIAKLDNSLNLLWLKNSTSIVAYTGGSGYPSVSSITSDGVGNVYVTGTMNTVLTFGTTTIYNAGGTDVFVVKYDVNGNVKWAKSAGGNSYDGGKCISADGYGNIYVTGYFQSAGFPFGTTTLLNAATIGTDVFLLKFDTLGNEFWAKSAGGNSDDYGYFVGNNAAGDVFVGGIFGSSSIIFGVDTLINSSSTFSVDDAFLAKYSSSGNVLWSNSIRGAGEEGIVSGALSKETMDDNGYVVGYYGSSGVFFDTISFAGPCGMFIAKFGTTVLNTPQLEKTFGNITIFPNPASIELTIVSTYEINNLAICNILGDVVYNHTFNSKNLKIDISGLPSGVYFVKVNNIEFRKFIKQQ